MGSLKMNVIDSRPAPFFRKIENEWIVFENEFARWGHSEKSGQLMTAVVKNGSGENLLTEPFLSRIIRREGGKEVTYAAGNSAESVRTDAHSIAAIHRFFSDEGKELPHFRMEHHIRYGEFGEGFHTLKLIPESTLRGITSIQPVIFGVRNTMNWLGIRSRYAGSVGYWSQNPVSWHTLHGGKSFQDMEAYLSNHLPLSFLFLQSGREAIQFETGDDLLPWEPFPGYQEGAVLYNKEKKGYTARLSIFLARENEALSEPVTLSFRLTLPFVRRNIVPFRRAAPLLVCNRGFEKRWPEEKDFAGLSEAGYDLLCLHCDRDMFGRGIFWRDAVYPPFPPEEMKKMDHCIHSAHRHGIRVVPYFSVKEMHPEADGYAENVLKWAHLSTKDSPVRTSVFGSVMCLQSGWDLMRRKTILEPMEKHDFDGIYYDWCAGIECDNRLHAGQVHWDNECLLHFLKWTCECFSGQRKERYLHCTFVPSLAVENIATMIITEELSFPEISPEMFSPHVHFLNIAPRQICDTLPGDAPDRTRLKLAMCALLHHASVSSRHPVYLDFYARQPWLNSVTRYEKHAAPGETIISSEDPEVGFSLYWNDSELLITGANLSDTGKGAECTIRLPGLPEFSREMSLDPLSVSTQKIKKAELQNED